MRPIYSDNGFVPVGNQPLCQSALIWISVCVSVLSYQVTMSYNELSITDEFEVMVYIVNPSLKVEYH